MLFALCGLVGFAMGALIVFYVSAGMRTRSMEREAQAIQHVQAGDQRHTEATRLASQQLQIAEQRHADAAQTAARAAADRAEATSYLVRKVAYEELQKENAILKRELRSCDVVTRKLELDTTSLAAEQREVAERANAVAARYLEDVEKWIGEKINANNFAACKQRLLKVIEWARSIGYTVSDSREAELLTKLKADFEGEVRRQIQREEQARIKAQIREEEKLARELERERVAAERERAAVQAALQKAMAEAHGEHTAEIQSLKSRLADAEARVVERTLSQAQITRAGHIYIISNIGSFGENLYKIGMTRRLEPMDRVFELGDASVPFPFDVHMMISSVDAPALENKLHRHFARHRLNRVNPRKEFFRLDLEAIRRFVVENHGQVEFVGEPEASQFRQSVTMSAEDQATIDAAFERAEAELGAVAIDD